MKIAFDAKRIFHNNTGLGNYSRTLVRNIVEFFPEHEYFLFTPSISDQAYSNYFLNTDRFQIFTAGISNKSIWRSYKIPRILDELDIDIYHGLSHEIPLNRGKGKTRYVLSFHDLIYEIYPSLFPVFDRLMYKFKYRKSSRLADHIVSISTSTSKDLERLYHIPKDKMTTVFQSCSQHFLSTENKIPQSSRSYFLYVGSVIPRKGLMKIAKALEYLDPKDRPLIKVIGQGDAYLADVQLFLKEADLSASMEFMGNVDNEDLLGYYQNAHALILPSQYEGFGIPIIEALSQKTPVITSKTSSMPEAAGPGGILIDPNRPEEIASAIQFVLQNEATCTEMAQFGKDYVHRNFSAASTARNLMEVYKGLV